MSIKEWKLRNMLEAEEKKTRDLKDELESLEKKYLRACEKAVEKDVLLGEALMELEELKGALKREGK